MEKLLITITFIFILNLTGCSTSSGGDVAKTIEKATIIIGSKVDKIITKKTGIRGFGLTFSNFGKIFGKEYVKFLNEQEQRKALNASKISLDSGQTGEASKRDWESNQNTTVAGYSKVTSNSTNTQKREECKETLNTFIDKNGNRHSKMIIYCRNTTTGNWENR